MKQISDAELDALRKEVDRGFLDPNYTIVLNHDWEAVFRDLRIDKARKDGHLAIDGKETV